MTGAGRSALHRTFGTGVALLMALTVMLFVATGAGAATSAGALYTLTNATSGNAVAVFNRSANGSLHYATSVPTGGRGNGGALGSQGSLVLSPDHQWLFAVNAGSNSVSVLTVNGNTVAARDVIGSGGSMPISLTVHGQWLYVLNAGGAGNVTGFTINREGQLSPIPYSTHALSGAGVGPAQVQFTADGRSLVVTEKNTNRIDTFRIDSAGRLVGPVVTQSSGATPFGFDITPRGTLIVSEASGAVSSYRLASSGHFGIVSGSVPTTETAACWLIVSKNARYAYTANAGSNSITGYAIDLDGRLTILNADGKTGNTGAHPTDMAQSADGAFLYTLDNGDRQISMFAVNANGSLTHLGALGGLPASAVGLAGW